MNGLLLTEWPSSRRANQPSGSHLHAVPTHLVQLCRVAALSKFFYGPMRPETRTQRRDGNFTRHRSDQSRGEFSLGGVYASIDEDAVARSGRRHRSASTPWPPPESVAAITSCRAWGHSVCVLVCVCTLVCVCVTAALQLPGVAGVDQSASSIGLECIITQAVSVAPLVLMQIYGPFRAKEY